MKVNMNNYRETIRTLELPTFWENQLKSKSLKEGGVALRVLDNMNEDASSLSISHIAESQSNKLRKQAKSIFIKFDSNDAFKFLENDFDKDFNALDEVRIHDALKERSLSKPIPQLIHWISTAKNENFKAFLIQEIGFFNQIESADQLINIYNETKSSIIKSRTALALAKLKYEPAIPALTKDYHYNKLEVQSAIIDALGEIGGTNALSFLEKVYHQTHNKDMLIKVIQKIHKIDTLNIAFTKLKNEAKNDFEKLSFKYIEQRHDIR